MGACGSFSLRVSMNYDPCGESADSSAECGQRYFFARSVWSERSLLTPCFILKEVFLLEKEECNNVKINCASVLQRACCKERSTVNGEKLKWLKKFYCFHLIV